MFLMKVRRDCDIAMERTREGRRKAVLSRNRDGIVLLG